MAPAPTSRRLYRLCLKELRETIRDRRTIVTLLLMPLLVYPLLSMALNRFLLTSGTPSDGGYKVGVQTEAEGLILQEWLQDARSMPPDVIVQASGGEIAEFTIVTTGDDTAVQAVESNGVDVAAEVTAGDESTPPEVRFISFRGDNASLLARRILIERLQWLTLAEAQQIVTRIAPKYRGPATISISDVGEIEEPSTLGTIIPLVLVLMTITGAVYPAIDLTAGERERGTMEALMASPVPRGYVLFAKYVAVVIVALLTAVANLLAMFTTLWASGLLSQLTGSDAFPWIAVFQILGLLILFSCFFAALLLSLTSFAKSFKEAQAYLIPIMLLSLAPAMLSLLPGVTLSGPLAIAPLISIVLLARDVLAGNVNPVGAVAAIVSTIAYAAAALSIASKLFGSDAVTRTSDLSIGTMIRRPLQSRATASPSAAAMTVAFLVPIYFLVSSSLMRYLGGVQSEMKGAAESLSDPQMLDLQVLSMILSAVALIGVFGAVPLAAALWERCKLLTTYRVRSASPVAFVGAVLLGLGSWAVAHEALLLVSAMGLAPISEDKIEQTRKVLEVWQNVPPWIMLATLALTPAVIEELCFRGYLFAAFSRVMSPVRTIALTAFLFGMFHVLTGGTLLLERFVPSTLLGVIIGWVAYRTGSVLPGILMHFVHNGLLEMAGHYKDQLVGWGLDAEEQSHLPFTWLATATGIALLGAVLVWFARRKEVREPLAE